MKNLIKLVSLTVLGTAAAVDVENLSSREVVYQEINAPAGVFVDKDGRYFEDSNKSFIDLERPVGGTSIRYYSSAAAAMNNVYTADYAYSSPGCRSGVSTAVSMDEAVNLPAGSKIVSFNAYGNDNSDTGGAIAYLYTTDMADGALSIHESYLSGTTPTPGDFNIGGYLDLNIAYSDSLFVRLNGTNSDIINCGFRIGYVPPNVASDLIFVNNFYR